MTVDLRVLIVEDQWTLADAFALRLEREGGFVVLPTVADRAGALRSCIDSAPDVVVLDVDIVGSDGFGIAEEILTIAPDAAVLMISEFANDDDVARAPRLGACTLISKREAAGDVVGAVRRRAVHPIVALNRDDDETSGR